MCVTKLIVSSFIHTNQHITIIMFYLHRLLLKDENSQCSWKNPNSVSLLFHVTQVWCFLISEQQKKSALSHMFSHFLSGPQRCEVQNQIPRHVTYMQLTDVSASTPSDHRNDGCRYKYMWQLLSMLVCTSIQHYYNLMVWLKMCLFYFLHHPNISGKVWFHRVLPKFLLTNPQQEHRALFLIPTGKP